MSAIGEKIHLLPMFILLRFSFHPLQQILFRPGRCQSSSSTRSSWQSLVASPINFRSVKICVRTLLFSNFLFETSLFHRSTVNPLDRHFKIHHHHNKNNANESIYCSKGFSGSIMFAALAGKRVFRFAVFNNRQLISTVSRAKLSRNLRTCFSIVGISAATTARGAVRCEVLRGSFDYEETFSTLLYTYNVHCCLTSYENFWRLHSCFLHVLTISLSLSIYLSIYPIFRLAEHSRRMLANQLSAVVVQELSGASHRSW